MGGSNSKSYNFNETNDIENFVCIAGMGDCGSKSKSSQTITNNTVNKNFMNTLNKTIMNSAVETMINNANACSSSVDLNNLCNLELGDVANDLIVSGNQSNDAKVQFNCIQANKTSSDMASAMMASMIAEMKSLNGTEAAANLNNAAQASSKTGFVSMPQASSSSSDTNVTNNITNETINTVQNIFEQNLSNNFSANTVNECTGRSSATNVQTIKAENVGGSVDIDCFQSNTVEQVQNCKQLSDAVSKTTQATFQELGLAVETESDTKITTESEISSMAKTIGTGPIEEVGNAVSNVLTAFGLAFLGPVAGPICMCCCCLIIIGILMFVAYQIFGNTQGSMGKLDQMGQMNFMDTIGPLGSSDFTSDFMNLGETTNPMMANNF